MRPFVVLKFSSGSLWTNPACAHAIEHQPRLENESLVDAFEVDVSPVVVDGEAEFHFARLPALPGGADWPLDACIRPIEPTLAGAISRSVVKRVMNGDRPTARWPIQITYRDDEGREYVTVCEIRVVRMPLQLTTTIVSRGEEPTADPSRAAPAAARY
jgi:hypothetical protein